MGRHGLRARVPALGLAGLLLAGCATGGSTPATSPVTAATTPSPSPTAAPAVSPTPADPGIGPRALTVDSHPSGAEVELTGADGITVSGTTPYRASVTGGDVTVTLRMAGYNEARRTVRLQTDSSLDVWLDPAGQLVTSLVRWDTGPNPKQVAFTPDGRQVWTTLLGGHGVQVYEAATGQLQGQVTLGRHGAVEVIFTRDGRTAFISQMETASVYEVDTETLTVRRSIDGKGEWSKVMALAPDEETLYLANWISNDVSEIDLNTGTVRRLIPTVATPRGLFVTPDGTKLYVAGYDEGEIQVIDLATGTGEVLIRTGGAMRHLVGDVERMRLYASDMATAQVHVVDLRTDAVSRLGAVDQNPNTIDLSPDGRVLFVSCRGRNGPDYERAGPEWGSVLLLDTATGRLLDAIVGGNQPTGLDLSPDGTHLAYSDFLDDRISVFQVPPTDALLTGGGGRGGVYKRELVKS